jgi:ABC-type phosphate transport system permease subunit
MQNGSLGNSCHFSFFILHFAFSNTMSTTLAPVEKTKPQRIVRRRTRPKSGAMTLLAQGEPMIWLTGGALVLSVVMILGLLSLVVVNALSTFWPDRLVEVTTADGRKLLGEVTRDETYTPTTSTIEALPDSHRASAKDVIGEDGQAHRRLLRTGNYELTNEHFNWVSDFEVVEERQPDWAVIFERRQWGRFYGTPKSLMIDDKPAAGTSEDTWARFEELLPEITERFEKANAIREHDLGKLNAQEEDAELEIVQAKLSYGPNAEAVRDAEKHLEELKIELAGKREGFAAEVAELEKENARYSLVVTTASGQDHAIPLSTVVLAYPANQLSFGERLGVYFERWREFLFDMPREANTEGGVFPAIWGTVVMTIIMAVAVVPFGVLAALYLKEYAKAGPVVSMIRIAINNLAGVPSIVFGVFGLIFFCYIIGGFIDGGPKNVRIDPWPSGTWFVAVGILAACGTGAFLLGIYNLSVRKAEMTQLRKVAAWGSVAFWIASVVMLVLVIAHLPFFDGFYQAKLAYKSSPTFGKGALIWASFTLALLTLPVVIVATEEALSAVPNSMREGSYACGASKWQTIRRIVLPRAMPGIMTGMILAMARGAGEVAPLMLVGAVKVAPDLPVDTTFPFVHPDRSFLHLGFHIYDVGFQSPNSEAAIPLVYTTTLLLISIVATLNIFAVWMRARLRRRFVIGQF